LVETALSLILLLTIVFGVMQISMALYADHFISDAAREGTRYAIVRGSACNASITPCPAAATDIQDYVRTLGFPGINPNTMTVTTTWPTTGTSCTPSSTPCNNPGNLVRVTVDYQIPFALPFAQVSTLTLTSTSQMVISQ
jgi:Flp pilus assembly protein TadG